MDPSFRINPRGPKEPLQDNKYLVEDVKQCFECPSYTTTVSSSYAMEESSSLLLLKVV